MSDAPMMTLAVDPATVETCRASLGELADRLPAIFARAVNRAMQHARTMITEKATHEIDLPQAAIRKRVLMKKATQFKPTAITKAAKVGWPLIMFGASQDKALGGGTYTSAGFIKSGFIQTMKSGHRGVYLRNKAKFMAHSSRPAIDEMRSQSLTDIIVRINASPEIVAEVSKVLNERIVAETELVLKGTRK
jgi:hypothetical protein